MLVSTRISFVAIILAAGCADPVAMSGDDDGTEDVRLQCTSPLPCPAPSGASKQTICGQLFDFEDNAKLGGSTGSKCMETTESGPCSLTIDAYDAIGFASNPTSTVPLAHGGLEIDTCGRYRITDIEVTGIGPFIALAIDDAAHRGPAGTTVTVTVATPKVAGTATDQLEAWIVRESTTTQWSSSGGPALADGMFVPVFRAHMLGTPQTDPFETQSGVTFTALGNPIENYYFDAESLVRTNIDSAAVATGANGTVLFRDASINQGAGYSGNGGLSDPVNCRWPHHAGMALPGIVFIQIFRPAPQPNAQCSL